MTKAIVLSPEQPQGLALRKPRRALLEAWLEGRSQRTLRAYQADMADFARFIGMLGVEEAATYLTSLSQPEAHELVLSYRGAMLEKKLAPSTINRRLAAIRSLVKLANMLGHTPWLLNIPSVRSQSYRDTRGPGADGVRKLLEAAGRLERYRERNRAILRLLYSMALRRGEVAELELEHLDLSNGRLSVLGKGRKERVWLTVAKPLLKDLEAWLVERGNHPGSLFDLTGNGIWKMLRQVSAEAGMDRVRPHGLRHAGITEALDRTQGDVRAVQKFSRHLDLKTLMVYDDNRQDHYGQISEMLASEEDE